MVQACQETNKERLSFLREWFWSVWSAGGVDSGQLATVMSSVAEDFFVNWEFITMLLVLLIHIVT